MTDEEKLDKFVEELSKCAMAFKKPVENMYAKNKNTVNNLKLYLKEMLEIKPKYLLVGEAPGYKGCRWSGIPFTSEEILVNNRFFGLEKGYKVRDKDNPEAEDSSTIVWDYFKKRFLDRNMDEKIPLMWNAFPFYPCGNREPNAQEIEFGRKIIKAIIEIFNIKLENIIAAGRIAEDSLKPFYIKEVRHPACGGQKAFAQGLDEYLYKPCSSATA